MFLYSVPILYIQDYLIGFRMTLRLAFPILRQRLKVIGNIRKLSVRFLQDAAETKPKDDPIKYTTSEAGKWKAKYTTAGETYFTYPKHQDVVIVASLTVFMVYFCIYREENDLDEWLKDLEKTAALQIREMDMSARIEQAKQRGLETSLMEAKLKKIQKEIEEVRQ